MVKVYELLKFDFGMNKLDYRVNYLKSFISKNGITRRKMLRENKKHKYKITTLDEVLEVVNDKILLIEIKYNIGDKFNLEKFVKLIHKYKNKNILIQSFSKKIIKDLKIIDNKLKLGMLYSVYENDKINKNINFISINSDVINNDILVSNLYNKRSVNVWTVNYYKQFKKLVKNMDGKINDVNIITDYPNIIKKYLDKVNR